ncbi:RNA polymerase sigma factor [Spirillospora sp. CA-142024]|uniref:RNA polymerase sigma factor n=1 Tax=Spirillospora sp. CA-142024 TaxID=3240036 RepID=UPI003D8AB03D
MGGDLGSLYDVHADRLYAYCWSLVGDRLAAAALADTFSAAVHQPPRGDSVLWLYSLSRTACAEHGAFTGELGGRGEPLFTGSDPLLRAASGLRSDHREVLLLSAGEWLETHDIARVLGLAPDTVAQLLNAARTRLERAVLDVLMRGTTEPQLELISAFEKGRLPRLLAKRAPSRAPRELRDPVLAASEEEADRPLPTVAAPSPLVVIGSERKEPPKRGLSGGVSKGLGAAAGVAASAAAVIGLLVSWPAAKGGDAASLVPTASKGQTHPASTTSDGAPRDPAPGLTGSERVDGSPGASQNPVTSANGTPPQAGGAQGGGSAPASSPSGPARKKPPSSDTPTKPDQPSTPPETTTPPQTPSDPATPPDGGSTDPTTPPTDTPSDPPPDSGTPSPTPTTNPTPEPGQG